MKMHTKKILSSAAAIVAVTLAQSALRAGTSTNSSGQPTQQGIGNPAVTISFSGQTALRSFNTSGALTELQPGSTIILHDGASGAPITYTAPNNSSTFVQLASPDFTSVDAGVNNPSATSQRHSAIRLEWHEQGSIDGFYDLINDQIGYATSSPISNGSLRTPSSSNPTWINTNKFTSATSANGFTLGSVTSTQAANTYDSTVYNQATGVNILGGQNRVQFSVGENPTEAVAVAGTANPFVSAGSAGYGLGNTALTPASTLTALGVGGARQTFQPKSILNESTDKIDPQTPNTAYTAGPWNSAGTNNITSTNIAATAVTYSANPGTGLQRIDKGDAQWLQTTGRLENGALFNVVARTVDTGQRVVFALNTGIDPSWAVGSNDDGNSTSSTNAAAQHSVGPSLRFDGKTSGTEAATTIGASRMAVGALSVPEARAVSSAAPVRALDVDFNDQTNDTNDAAFVRANINTIISSDPATRYQAVLISHYNSVKTPSLSALNNELTHEGLPTVPSTSAFQTDPVTGNVFTNNLTENQLQTAWANVQSFDPATAETDSTPASASVSGIKGDTTGDVAAVISNVVNSNAIQTVSNPINANNPADGLLSTGFIPTGLLNWKRATDGGPISPQTPGSQQAAVIAAYGPLFTTDSSAGANGQTIGTSSVYGGSGSANGVAINGNIAITAKETNGTADGNGTIAPAGNYLFGNFNQNGVRDYSAVQASVSAALALTQQDVVSGGGKDSIFTPDGGVTNGTVISSLSGPLATSHTNTKGDLIALGDFNGDGKFDGQDVYELATGASLADSSSSVSSALNSTATLTATATTFADAVRSPNAVLFKNTALDYTQNVLNNAAATNPQAVAFLEKSARVVLTTSGAVPAGATDLHTTDPITGLEQYTYDPNGTNAFNKFDVNRDGRVSLNDLAVVDKFIGADTGSLTDQVSATIAVDGSVSTSLPQQQFNLINATLIDNKAANGLQANVNGNGPSANNGQGPSLFSSADGQTRARNILRTDFDSLANYAQTHDSSGNVVSLGSGILNPGDVNLDGGVDNSDLRIVLGNFGQPSGDQALTSHWTFGDIAGGNFATTGLLGDGTVDNTDLRTVLNNFGGGSSAALAALQADDISLGNFDVAFNPQIGQFIDVPEPASIVLLMGGFAGLLARRRKHQCV
jgi:Ca2+-binding EF-hand superfamily protein